MNSRRGNPCSRGELSSSDASLVHPSKCGTRCSQKTCYPLLPVTVQSLAGQPASARRGLSVRHKEQREKTTHRRRARRDIAEKQRWIFERKASSAPQKVNFTEPKSDKCVRPV